MANIFAAEIARTLRDIEITQANIARDQALLAADPGNTRLQQQIASGQAYIIDLNAQLAFFQQVETAPVASSGNLANDDARAKVDNASVQDPSYPSQILNADGRITTPPDTTSVTTADKAVTYQSVDSGTNAPVRSLIQTQSVPTNGYDGLLRTPGYFEETGSSTITTASPGGQPGVGATGDDSGARVNSTRTEIDNIFNEAAITPQPNVLDQYASYTYSASIYLTTEQAYKTMMSTKKKSVVGCQLLIQSGGMAVGARNSKYFTNDYYIDKIELNSKIIGKGTTMSHNVVDAKMTIVEPNGITLIDNLDLAVSELLGSKPGEKKNFTSAVYLLVLRFYGYDDQGNLVRGGVPKPDGSSDPNAFVEKFYPLLIKKLDFKISNKLVEYNIEAAVAHYQISASSSRGSIPYNIELSGQTLKDVLSGPAVYAANQTSVSAGGNGPPTVSPDAVATDQGTSPQAPPNASAAPTAKKTVRQGLMAALNDYQQQLVTDGTYTYPDEYSVEFITPALEKARIVKAGTTVKNKTSMPTPGTAADQILPEKNSFDAAVRTMSATAGMQLVQFLDQLCRNSTYLEDQQLVKLDEKTGKYLLNGTPAENVAWFKISMEATAKVELGQDPKRKDYAYKIKYIISPYKINQINSQYFPKPKFNGVHKQYNYWFTGQNTSVLSYEESLNALYAQVLSGTNLNMATTSTSSSQGANDSELLKKNFQPRSGESGQGADGKTNEPVANAAEMLFSPADLKVGTVTIVGDPAWLQQGEAFAGQNKNSWSFSAFLPDGTINIDSQQPLFEVAFNKPGDYNLQTGLIDPNSSPDNIASTRGTQQPGAAQISRIYRATDCTSTFSKGKFTQILKGSLLINAPTNTQTTNSASSIALQKSAVSALSPNRQGTGALIAGSLSTPAFSLTLPDFAGTATGLSVGAINQSVNAGLNLLNNNVLGTIATRPVTVPTGPTSSGLLVGTVNSIFNPPSKLTGLINTPGFNPAADQQSQAGVVDGVSNGVTQLMTSSDDAGDLLTQQYLNTPMAEQTQALTEVAPNDLGNFFG